MEDENNVVVEAEPEAEAPAEEQTIVPIIQQEPKKKKKSHKGLIIFLIIFLVVFVITPGTLFLLVYDTSMMKVTLDESFDQEKFTNSLVYDSLDNVKDDGLVKFSVSESDINNLIYSTYKENTELKKYLKQMAVDVKNDKYVFNISAKLGFFQTRLKLTTKLEKTMIAKDGGAEEEAYAFIIKDITLGKLPMKDLAMTILKNAITEDVKNSLHDSPLKLNIDLDKSRFYIFTSDFTSMINEAMGSASSSSEYGTFLASFINDFLESQLLQLDFYGNESLTAQVNLNKITGNDYDEGQYVNYSMPYEDTTTNLSFGGEQKKLSLDTIRDALVVLLNNNLVTKEQMSDVSEYLFNGYHDSNAPSCDLSAIGISDKTTYKGFNLYPNFSIDSLVSNLITNFSQYDSSQNSFNIANLSESDINRYLHTQRIFGNKYFLTSEVEAGQYKSSYVAFDNAYINVTNDKAVLSIGLNVNGLETILTILLDYDAALSSGTKLVYNTVELYFGGTNEDGSRIAASEGTKSLMFTTLGGSVNCSSFTFSQDGKLTIDFADIIEQGAASIGIGNAEYKNFLQNEATIAVSVDGTDIVDNSVIRIVANRI